MNKAELTFDTKQFFARLNLADKTVAAAAKRGVQEITLDLERKSGELTPVDEGTLLGSSATRVKQGTKDVEGTVSYNTPYAAAVHERMVPAPAPSVGSIMQPGPRTRAKPGNEFGPAGGWYLRRPLLGKAKQYWEHVAKTIKTALDSKGPASG